MAIYNKAFETEVWAEGEYVYITQTNENKEDDLIQLNADQAAWLLAELEVAMREVE